MTDMEVKKILKKHLKGATSTTIESLAKRIGILPSERAVVTTDIGIALAATSLRAAIEFLKAAPEVSRLIDIADMRVWAEIGRRLSATSGDTSAEFLQVSADVLEATPQEMRGLVLKLASKQAALSANTALECFRISADLIRSIDNPASSLEVLNVCLELARHSVKHSDDLFRSSPRVLASLKDASTACAPGLVERALGLTSSFAFKSGGTAAEFFSELPQLSRVAAQNPAEARESIDELLENTQVYLERSGGVALQYYKAASRVLYVAGRTPFQRWSRLAGRVGAHGNAASYHFMKASPQIIAELAARAGADRRSVIVSTVLEIVEEIGQKNSLAAVECFKASTIALGAATLSQFGEWARRGLENCSDPKRLQAYYALESKGSQQALFRIEGGLTLESVAHTLRLYVEGLTGRALNIAPLGSIPEETKIGDGKTIYLPSVVAEFENEPENFRLFKVIAAHAAGQVEFCTYAVDLPETHAALLHVRSVFMEANAGSNGNGKSHDKRAPRKKQMVKGVDFQTVLSEFPNQVLASKLFTTLENGRIDYLLRTSYRGIRRDLDFVRARLLERRPDLSSLAPEVVPFELLFQIAICGGASEQARRTYRFAIAELEGIVQEYIQRPEATVADSLVAASRVYKMLAEQPLQQGDSGEEQDSEESEGEESSGDAAESKSEARAKEMPSRPDPLSYWSSAPPEETNLEPDFLNQMKGAESSDQELEKGDTAFYYDEWDRELGDYRTRWCRIIERTGARGSRGFVEMVRGRYAGVISSVRYQFQLLRPENLRRIRGEVDGEDFDLQAVIDYALDKRSTGLIDDRLYTRKLRRERDVAVSFLLDMSSSTARTISRFPNKPYTQPGQRIIDIEKEGLVLMSEALEAVGDLYAIQGFTSEGRRNVKFYMIKDFSEPYSSEIERRIGGITYQNNTRLGAAIRHAGAKLASRDARTRLLIVLSDGRPYDHDYGDSRYAREDTRIALRQARLAGITPFCITIDRESEEQLRDMYGEVGYTIIDDVMTLPERLPGIYTRLTT